MATTTIGYDGATIEEPIDDFWSWLLGNVWISRIVVTAFLVVVLEYLFRKPVPQIWHRNHHDDDDDDDGGVRKKEKTVVGQSKTQEKAAIIRAERAANLEQQQQKQPVVSIRKDDNNEVTVVQGKKHETSDSEEPTLIRNGMDDEAATELKDSAAATERLNEKSSPAVIKPAKVGTNNKNVKKRGKMSSSDALPDDVYSSSAATTEAETPKANLTFKNNSPHHPGMEGFNNWYDIETSLYRQFTVGRSDGVDVLPPYVPKSRNGQVRVALRVTNDLTLSTENQVINVFWMNYLGHEESKGTIHRGETWTQTTYVEHPWVFRRSDTNELLLHYIPERVIPHLEEAPTIDESNPMVGLQSIIITRPTEQALREHHICSVIDKVLPHPGRHHFHNPNQAISWTLLQMTRNNYFDYYPGAKLLCKYLTNIAMHPDNAQYRHIRIANKSFYNGIWQTPARGLLLAAGFCEQHAHAELGTAAPLPAERVQDVSLVLFRLEQYLTKLEQQQGGSAAASVSADRPPQPAGADGSGRAGFGQAGQMNFRR